MDNVLAHILEMYWWHWVLLLLGSMLVVILILSLAVDRTHAPVIFSKRDRKSIRRLVLPASAVRIVVTDTSDQGTSTSTEKESTARQRRPLMGKVKANWTTLRKFVKKSRPKRYDWDSFEICHRSLKQDQCGDAPLLVFVNSRSGGQQGAQVLAQLRVLFHDLQVVSLPEATPEAAIQWWSKHVKNYRVLVCGGDGTAAWVLGVLEKMQECLDYVPPVAILPLGTGNDLARVLGWGGGYTGGSVLPILQQVSNSHTAVLDRWNVTCRDGATLNEEQLTLCNYFGIGVDAAVALDFHNLRDKRPELFFSRLLNKVWYAWGGVRAVCSRSARHLSSKISMECDGIPLEIPSNLEGIVVLNIGSFGGGTDLWGCPENSTDDKDDDSDDSDEEMDTLAKVVPRMNDGKLEVVGVQGALQLGVAQVGLSSFVRLAQASHIKIKNHKALPIQVDGEPRNFAENGNIEIDLRGQAFVLARSVVRGDAMATEIVDFAWESKMISAEQRSQLLNRIANNVSQREVIDPIKMTFLSRLRRALLSFFPAC